MFNKQCDTVILLFNYSSSGLQFLLRLFVGNKCDAGCVVVPVKVLVLTGRSAGFTAVTVGNCLFEPTEYFGSAVGIVVLHIISLIYKAVSQGTVGGPAERTLMATEFHFMAIGQWFIWNLHMEEVCVCVCSWINSFFLAQKETHSHTQHA